MERVTNPKIAAGGTCAIKRRLSSHGDKLPWPGTMFAVDAVSGRCFQTLSKLWQKEVLASLDNGGAGSGRDLFSFSSLLSKSFSSVLVSEPNRPFSAQNLESVLHLTCPMSLCNDPVLSSGGLPAGRIVAKTISYSSIGRR